MPKGKEGKMFGYIPVVRKRDVDACKVKVTIILASLKEAGYFVSLHPSWLTNSLADFAMRSGLERFGRLGHSSHLVKETTEA